MKADGFNFFLIFFFFFFFFCFFFCFCWVLFWVDVWGGGGWGVPCFMKGELKKFPIFFGFCMSMLGLFVLLLNSIDPYKVTTMSGGMFLETVLKPRYSTFKSSPLVNIIGLSSSISRCTLMKPYQCTDSCTHSTRKL